MDRFARSTRTVLCSLACAASLNAIAAAQCTCLGDYNHDGVVDGADLGALLGAWGTLNPNVDLDANGIIDGADLGVLLASWGACAAPANDLCENAFTMTKDSYKFCTALATSTPLPLGVGSCGLANEIYNDIWYRWVAPGDGFINVSTCGAADFDTVIGIYENAPGQDGCPNDGVSSLTLIGCSDDFDGCDGATSLAWANVKKDRVYKIRIGGFYGGGSGAFSLGFDPAGDSCYNPIQADSSATDQDLTGNNSLGQTVFAGSCLSTPAHASWVRYTAPCSGVLTVSTCNPGTMFDTVVTVYSEQGSQCNLSELGCDDDASNEACLLGGEYRKSFVNIPVVNGGTYFVRIAGHGFNTVGDWELKLSLSCQ